MRSPYNSAITHNYAINRLSINFEPAKDYSIVAFINFGPEAPSTGELLPRTPGPLCGAAILPAGIGYNKIFIYEI